MTKAKRKIYLLWCDGNDCGCVEYDNYEDAIKDTEHSQYAEAIIEGKQIGDKDFSRFCKAVAKLVRKINSRKRKIIKDTFKWLENHDNERTRQ